MEGTTEGGADVLQIEDSGDALDISQPIVADEAMLKLLKQQVGRLPCDSASLADCMFFARLSKVVVTTGSSLLACLGVWRVLV